MAPEQENWVDMIMLLLQGCGVLAMAFACQSLWKAPADPLVLSLGFVGLIFVMQLQYVRTVNLGSGRDVLIELICYAGSVVLSGYLLLNISMIIESPGMYRAEVGLKYKTIEMETNRNDTIRVLEQHHRERDR